MEMGFENVFQFHTVFLQPLQIWLGFTKRVNNGSLAIAGNVIGTLCKASGIDLFNVPGIIFLIFIMQISCVFLNVMVTLVAFNTVCYFGYFGSCEFIYYNGPDGC